MLINLVDNPFGHFLKKKITSCLTIMFVIEQTITNDDDDNVDANADCWKNFLKPWQLIACTNKIKDNSESEFQLV